MIAHARWVIPLALATGLRVAAAQPAGSELAREFQAGVDSFRLGKYDDAKAHLDKAKALDPKRPGPHRFLGAVAQAQGRWQDCVDETRTALQLNPDSDEAADTRKLHDECRGSAGRAPFRGEYGTGGAIAVVTNVPGATVKIGGLVYGGTPLAPRPIALGEREVTIEKSGWKSATAKAVILANIVTDLEIDLEPDPTAKSDVDVKVDIPPPMTTGFLIFPPELLTIPGFELSIDGKPTKMTQQSLTLEPGVHAVEIRAKDKEIWRRRVRVELAQKTHVAPELEPVGQRESRQTMGYGLLGGSAALAVVGLGASLAYSSAVAEARDIQRIETSRPLGADTSATAPIRTRAQLDDARSRADRWGLISNVAFGAAGVGLAVTAVYMYLGVGGERSDAPPPLAISPVAGGGAVVSLSREVSW
jgi:tetratricopeptide (TPR) repeat protein